MDRPLEGDRLGVNLTEALSLRYGLLGVVVCFFLEKRGVVTGSCCEILFLFLSGLRFLLLFCNEGVDCLVVVLVILCYF